MPLGIWGRNRASDTDYGEGAWFGEGLVHMVLWLPGPESRFGLGLGAGAGLGTECVNVCQGLGHRIGEVERLRSGRMVCKGGRA